MRSCPACGKANPDESAFCSQCGQPLSRSVKICPGCHKEISLEEVFCHYCGTRQPVEEAPKSKIRLTKSGSEDDDEIDRSMEGPNLLPTGSRRVKPVFEDLDEEDAYSYDDDYDAGRRGTQARKRPVSNIRPDDDDEDEPLPRGSRKSSYRDYDDYDDDDYEGMSLGLKIAIAVVGILAILAIGVVAWLMFGRGFGHPNTPTTQAAGGAEAPSTTAPTTTAPTTTAPEDTEPAPAETYGELQAINASVSASTTLDQAYYNPSYLMDFNADTAWAEGDPDGLGQGSVITYRFNTSSWIYGIAILPGFQRNQEVYEQYAAPSKLTVDTGKVKIPISLANYKANFRNPTTSCAYFKFSVPVKASQVSVSIDDVRPGTIYQDTCITEMYFFYYPADPSQQTSVKPTISSAGWENVTPTAAGNIGEGQSVIPPVSTDAAQEPTLTPPTQAAGDGDYILPSSSSAYVSSEELAGLTKEQLRLARNEIYARHGYRFSGEDLKGYFESKSWYNGTISPDSFDESVLNEYEIANINAIRDAENR